MNDDTQPLPDETPEVSESQFIPPDIPPKYKKKRSPKLVVLFIALVLIVGAATGTVFYLKKHKKQLVATTPTQQQAKVDTTQDVPDTANFKTYKSDNLNLQFKYPADWTITEKDGGIRVESPSFSYQTALAQTSGNFRIYIRQGSRTVDSKYIGKGVAIQPSEKLIYVAPANGQRKETVLSFFGFAEPNNFAYFMITSDYNLKKGDSLAPNYAHEPEAFLIAGGYSAPTNQDDLNFTSVPIEAGQAKKAYQKAIDILKSLQLS